MSSSFRRPPSLRRFTVAAALLFAGLWGLCLLPSVVTASLPGPPENDTNHVLGFRAHLIRMVWSGNFPDLAPGIYLGQPLLSVGQAAPLYPTNLLGLLIPIPGLWFYLFDLWIHAVLASTGVAWMLRRRGHHPLTALILGWVYTNSSVFLLRAWVGHWEMLHQVAVIPWALGLWEAMEQAREGRIHSLAVKWGAIWGLLLLTRNPQLLYALVLILAPLELWRLIHRRRLVPVVSRLLALEMSVLLAALLGAVALTPFLTGLGDSHRAAWAGPATAAGWPWVPFNTIALLSPFFIFGDSTLAHLGQWFPHEAALIMARGIPALAVGGLVALWLPPRASLRGSRALPVALLVGGVVIGMAGAMPWNRFLSDHLPLFGWFRAWGRANLFAALGLILLAAGGLDALFAHRRRAGATRSAMLLAASLSLGLCAALWMWLARDEGGAMEGLMRVGLQPHPLDNSMTFAQSQAPHLRGDVGRDLVWHAVWLPIITLSLLPRRVRLRWAVHIGSLGLLAAGAIQLQLFHWTITSQPHSPVSRPELASWLEERCAESAPAPFTVVIYPDDLANFGLQVRGARNIFGADSNMRHRYALQINALLGRLPSAYLLNTPRVSSVPQSLVQEIGVQGAVRRLPTPAAASSWMRADAFWVREFPVDAPYAEIAPESSNPNDERQGVRVVDWREDAISLEVHTAARATVIVREFPDPRWRIWVEGERHPTRETGHQLRIIVPSGGGRVELKFVDLAARVGVGVSLVSWLAFGIAGLSWCRRRRSAV